VESVERYSPEIVVIGASARAAAWSASHAFQRLAACDRFGDSDLREVATTVVSPTLRRKDVARRIGEQQWFEGPQPVAVLPAGGMENQPTLWKWLEGQAEFWGSRWQSVQKVRDLQAVARAVEPLCIRCPQNHYVGDAPPQAGRWLLKSRNSGGGIQVSCWEPSRSMSSKLELWPPSDYLQQYIEGIDYSATFVASQGEVLLVGLTRQLTGVSELGAQGWWYCGSVGPIPIESSERPLLEELGQQLVRSFQLEGIFGVDLRWDGKDWWLLEINPRYPAGAEVLERSSGMSVVELYSQLRHGTPLRWKPESEALVAKGIWFNQGESLGPARQAGITASREEGAPWQRSVADVPAVGEKISPGLPVFSVFSKVSSFEESVERLITTARIWETLIFAPI
jgi:predicted ATP-grasp superfamily ATP-dependent carboligase